MLMIAREKRDRQIVAEIWTDLLWSSWISERQRVGQGSDSYDQYVLELSPPAIMFIVVTYVYTSPRMLYQYSQLFPSVCSPSIPKPGDSR